MRKLLPHSLYLLRHVIENNGYCVTIAIPSTLQDGTPEPLGMSMSTMRGLEKRGYVKETHSGIWRATEEGKHAAPPRAAAGSLQHQSESLVVDSSEAPTKELSADQWQDISTAPKDAPVLRVYAPEFVHEDFNPTGTLEAYWQDGEGWVGAVWNPEFDGWDAKPIKPTHWRLDAPPTQQLNSAHQPELENEK